MISKIAPQQFPLFLRDFDGIVASDCNLSTRLASEILLNLSKRLIGDQQLVILDSLLRALKGASEERYRYLLLCAPNFDPELILPQLLKLYLSAQSNKHEKALQIAIFNVKDRIPTHRSVAVLSRVLREMVNEYPRFAPMIAGILAPRP